MRVLALADQSFDKAIFQEDYDLVLTLGDLTPSDLSGLDTSKVPALGVYGNHCFDYFKEFGIHDAHMKKYDWQGWSWLGFEGSVRYKPVGYHLYTQEEASRMFAKAPYADVLITHAPPRGIHDEEDVTHQGFDVILEYINKHQPKYAFHGHTYPGASGTTTLIGKTKVVYVTGAEIFDLSAA